MIKITQSDNIHLPFEAIHPLLKRLLRPLFSILFYVLRSSQCSGIYCLFTNLHDCIHFM